MSTGGMDPIRLRQLRAIAENLCTQANSHRDNNNYVVAYALYSVLCALRKRSARPSMIKTLWLPESGQTSKLFSKCRALEGTVWKNPR